MKKGLSVLVVLAMVLALAACGGQSVANSSSAPASSSQAPASTAQSTPDSSAEDTPAKNIKIGYVSSVGGLGDNNVNDMTYNGIKAATDALGLELDYVEPNETADLELYMTDFAKTGEYDLIVSNSSLANAPMQNVAKLYPDQKFLLVDNPVRDLPNVASLTYSKPHEGFLSGLACAYIAGYDEITVDGKTIQLNNSANTLGCILGVENPDGLEAVSGFMAGVKYLDPDINILYTAIGSWSDQATAREIALAHYDQGAQMIWQDSGAASMGVFTAAADRDLYTMGWNMPQHHNDPAHILFSVIKDLTGTTTDWITNWVNTGEFTSGVTDYNCKGGYIYVEWSDLFEVPAEMKKAVDDAFAVLSGDNPFDVPMTLEEVEAFDLRLGQ